MTPTQAKRRLKKVMDALEKIQDDLGDICEELNDDTLCDMLADANDHIQALIDDESGRISTLPQMMDYIDETLNEKIDEE